MLILGIDTSGSVAAAAIYDSEKDVVLAQQLIFTKRTHSQVILPLVERLFEDTELSLDDIGRIAVSAGPGSYTGLRIGIAAVKAMSFAKNIPCCGVSTLMSLSRQAHMAGEETVCAVMKARKGLVYAGLYHFGKDNSCGQLMDDAIMPEEELLQKLSQFDRVILTGDGAAEFISQYSPENALLASPEARLQNGAGLCRCAAFCEEQTPDSLEARYLQLVKAEKDRLDGNNNK